MASQTALESKGESSGMDSVYLRARKDWDDRYADLVLGKRNWQIAAVGLLLLSLIFASGTLTFIFSLAERGEKMLQG